MAGDAGALPLRRPFRRTIAEDRSCGMRYIYIEAHHHYFVSVKGGLGAHVLEERRGDGGGGVTEAPRWAGSPCGGAGAASDAMRWGRADGRRRPLAQSQPRGQRRARARSSRDTGARRLAAAPRSGRAPPGAQMAEGMAARMRRIQEDMRRAIDVGFEQLWCEVAEHERWLASVTWKDATNVRMD